MDKKRIAHRFTAALETYDQEASEQRRIARTLNTFLKLTYSGKPQPKRIIEVGCGTGLLSKMLRESFNPDLLFLNDLCLSVARLYQGWENTKFVAGDAEALICGSFSGNAEALVSGPFPGEAGVRGVAFPQRVDLIATSSVIQWFDRPMEFLLKCSSLLNKGGILAVAAFGPSTFRQIKHLTGQGLNYPSMEDFLKALSPCYEVLIARQEEIEQTFSSPAKVLEHLKRTGVTGVTANGPEFRWTRQALMRFKDDYIKNYPAEYVGKEAVTLTFQPIYLILKKPL